MQSFKHVQMSLTKINLFTKSIESHLHILIIEAKMDNFTRILNSGKIVTLQDLIWLTENFGNSNRWIEIVEQLIFTKIENLIYLGNCVSSKEFWFSIKDKIETLAKSEDKYKIISLFKEVDNFDVSMLLLQSHNFSNLKDLMFILDTSNCYRLKEEIKSEITKLLLSKTTSELMDLAKNSNYSEQLLLILETGKIDTTNHLILFGTFEGCCWKIWDLLCDLLKPLLKDKSEINLINLYSSLQWRYKTSFLVMICDLDVITDQNWLLPQLVKVCDKNLWIKFVDQLIPTLSTKSIDELYELTTLIPEEHAKPVWKAILDSGQVTDEAKLSEIGNELNSYRGWLSIIQTGYIKDPKLLLQIARYFGSDDKAMDLIADLICD
jgi:hypothetical protein